MEAAVEYTSPQPPHCSEEFVKLANFIMETHDLQLPTTAENGLQLYNLIVQEVEDEL